MFELIGQFVDLVRAEVADKLGRQFGRWWAATQATDDELERLHEDCVTRKGRRAENSPTTRPGRGHDPVRPDLTGPACASIRKLFWAIRFLLGGPSRRRVSGPPIGLLRP
ncbi:MAG: hypothetical protein JWO38_638 [Gemmataceae bacterium]|nr:hypothetical protein [Gemmataceae bacterium]